MTIISEKVSEYTIGKSTRVHFHSYLILCCDWCQKEFEIHSCVKYKKRCNFHFCCSKHQSLSQRKGQKLQLSQEQNFIEKFGVKTPLCVPEIHSRAVELANTKEAREKAKQTSIKNWGVPFPTQRPEHIAKCNLEHSIRKCNETKRKNGSMRESEPERQLYKKLSEHYGVENVVKHVRLHRCSIDMFVKPTNTYVQLDGVYWHGLDRDIEEHRKNASIDNQSKVILRKYERDRMLDEHCQNNNIRLIRVTDIEFNSDPQKALSRIISCE